MAVSQLSPAEILGKIRYDPLTKKGSVLDVVRLGRAIGVIYRPETERQSHYFHVRPSDQFDAMIHIDETRALEPLEPTSVWIAGQNPETYPSGL